MQKDTVLPIKWLGSGQGQGADAAKGLWNCWGQALPALESFVKREMSPSITRRVHLVLRALPELAMPSAVQEAGCGDSPRWSHKHQTRVASA